MEEWRTGRSIFKALGGLVILLASFFVSLRIIDSWSNKVDSASGGWSIKIEEATYGSNCGRTVARGNATSVFAKTCNGKPSCDFLISVEELGDPAPGCEKDFTLRFKCNPQLPVRGRYAKAEANRLTIHASCDSLE